MIVRVHIAIPGSERNIVVHQANRKEGGFFVPAFASSSGNPDAGCFPATNDGVAELMRRIRRRLDENATVDDYAHLQAMLMSMLAIPIRQGDWQ